MRSQSTQETMSPATVAAMLKELGRSNGNRRLDLVETDSSHESRAACTNAIGTLFMPLTAGIESIRSTLRQCI